MSMTIVKIPVAAMGTISATEDERNKRGIQSWLAITTTAVIPDRYYLTDLDAATVQALIDEFGLPWAVACSTPGRVTYERMDGEIVEVQPTWDIAPSVEDALILTPSTWNADTGTFDPPVVADSAKWIRKVRQVWPPL